MDTIKFNKTGWIILIIVIILIIAIAFHSTDNSPKQAEEEQESRISKLTRKWNQLVQQIEEEIQNLNLTLEMQQALERKINRYLIAAKVIFFALFTSIVAVFYFNDVDLINGLINTVGIFSTIFFGGSLLILTKFADPNAVIESCINWVRKTVYKKYGFDPTLIPIIQESIATKKTEAEEIAIALQYPTKA